jgi:thiol-disulfide isomerase/thioredoxin
MSLFRARLALVLISCAAAGFCACSRPAEVEAQASGKGAETERMLRDALQLPADTRLIFEDESGAPLTADQLAQRMQEGIKFTQHRDDAANTMTLRIEPKPEVIERLPEFDLVRLDGGRVTNADLMGQPALVNFFFETCVPCIKEVPALNEFRRKHPEFRYLAITHDSTADAKRFVEQRRFDWPVAPEAGAFIAAAGIRGFPTYLLLAPDGRVLGQGSGMNQKVLDDPVQALAELEQWVGERLPMRQ